MLRGRGGVVAVVVAFVGVCVVAFFVVGGHVV